eukprot:2237565-Rhodomonas_salina.1
MSPPAHERRLSNRDLQITEEFMDLARRISTMAASEGVEQASGHGRSPNARQDAFGQSMRAISVESPRQSRRRRSIEGRTGVLHTSEYFLGPRE